MRGIRKKPASLSKEFQANPGRQDANLGGKDTDRAGMPSLECSYWGCNSPARVGDYALVWAGPAQGKLRASLHTNEGDTSVQLCAYLCLLSRSGFIFYLPTLPVSIFFGIRLSGLLSEYALFPA